LDTKAHVEFFVKKLALPEEKFRVVYVGADDSLFRVEGRPGGQSGHGDEVLFVGTYNPLHGTDHIIEAARVLQEQEKPIRFHLVGTGMEYTKATDLCSSFGLTNVRFTEWIPYHRLPRTYAESTICLGIFGKTDKARRVIPTKVYQALAVGKPVITGDTPAAREILEHGKTAMLCRAGDGRALADAILMLLKQTPLREQIASAGHHLYRQRFTPQHIGVSALTVLQDALEVAGDTHEQAGM
jgi:glycosyltransferase involved in cell wall biosynthesis